jgi:hypothetical protein
MTAMNGYREPHRREPHREFYVLHTDRGPWISPSSAG